MTALAPLAGLRKLLAFAPSAAAVGGGSSTRVLAGGRAAVGRGGGVCVVAALFAAALTACAPKPLPPDRLTLKPAGFPDLAGWEDDRHGDALGAFRRSCARLEAVPDDRAMGPADGPTPGFGTVADWRAPCAEAETIAEGGDAAARAFFERRFRPYLAGNNGEPRGLFTGYFEPELRGARRPGGAYTVPLYRRPDDLVTVNVGLFRENLKGVRIAGRVEGAKLKPYDSRREIEAGSLWGRDLELVWVDDPVDAFFLHIQGSGRVVLEDGSLIRVGYAESNGHVYVAIGRELVARGELSRDEVTMQSIRAWLEAHPAKADEIMAANPSYVFFRELEGDGPIGAQGVPLTAERSLAVDRRFIAFGVPLWLDTTDPLALETPWRRLMVAQDTGGAIRGPVRGDVFWGAGDEAAARAGRMKAEGRYYLLLPKALAVASGR
jgi:membrane-bound lytic murein transglycosylase A